MASERRRHNRSDSSRDHSRKQRDRSGKDSRARKSDRKRVDELREQLIKNRKQNGRKPSSRSFSPKRKKRKQDAPLSEPKRKKLKEEIPASKTQILGKTFFYEKTPGETIEVTLERILKEKMELTNVQTSEKLYVPLNELGRSVKDKRSKSKSNSIESRGKRRSATTSAERSPVKKRKLSEERTIQTSADEIEEDLEMSGTEEPGSSPLPSPPTRGESLKDWNPKVRGCRYLEDSYEFLNDIDEGAYGMVSRYRDKFTGEIVALKRVKMEQTHHGFPKSSLREISCLLQLRHPNIVRVKEAVVSKNRNRHVYMAMEYCEHDFRALMLTRKFPWSKSEIKCLMQQLISGVAFMHDHYIFHRDLKTSNLLLTDDGHLKICDFGMARKFGSPIKKYTSLVVTLWYRAPEILLQEKPLYTQAVDVWSVGCILAEFFLNTPLFQAQEETAQIEKILEFLGTPSKEEWPEFHNFTSAQKLRKKYRAGFRNKLPIAGSAMANQNKIVLDDMGLELLLQLLQWDPKKRISAKDALEHAWFKQKPLPVNRELLPTFPSLNKEVRQKALRKARKEAEMLKQELAGGFHM